MLNNKILCIHCETHIGNLHNESSYNDYEFSTTVVPTRKGLLKKIKHVGTRLVDRYDSYVGFRVQFQIKCANCGKNTTNINSKDYCIGG